MTPLTDSTRIGSAHRARILDAAIELTATNGWQKITMSRIADEVGVSRQTVYNEMGSKAGLAHAMVFAELERFLAVVDQSFDQHPSDFTSAIRVAVTGVLELAQHNKLLQLIVSAGYGAETELLPLLTTDAGSLLSTAKDAIAHRVAAMDVPVSEHTTQVLIDLVVRMVLSHIMRPSGPPQETARDISWIIAAVLDQNAHQ